MPAKNNLEIGRCKNCRKYWKKEQLKPFIFLQPVGDGIIKKVDFLCLDCFHKLNEGLKYQKTQVEKDL